MAARPLSELRTSGLLWLINRAVFHPRGFALALHFNPDGEVTGWELLGDGHEVWVMAPPEDDNFQRAQATLHAAGER
jgi:hypothetical protein